MENEKEKEEKKKNGKRNIRKISKGRKLKKKSWAHPVIPSFIFLSF